MQDQPPVTGDAKADGRRVGKRGVAAAIPAGRNTKAAFHGAVFGVEGGDARAGLFPGGGQRIEAFGDADTVQLLAADCPVPVQKRVATADVQPVDAEIERQPVHHDFLQDRGLRHAETAERAGGGPACMDGVRLGQVMRDAIRAGGVDRNAGRHGRAPAGIGAGVEFAFEGHADNAAVAIGGEAAAHRGGVPLGGGDHGFMPGEDHAAWLAGLQHGKAEKRLQRDIQLGAEAAAGRCRDDAHLFKRQAQNFRCVLLVHHRRLRAGGNDEDIALHPGRAGFGLDRRMLDIGGLDRRLHGGSGSGQTVGAVAAENTACHQQIAVASRVKLGGARRPCRGNLDCRLAFLPCDRKV